MRGRPKSLPAPLLGGLVALVAACAGESTPDAPGAGPTWVRLADGAVPGPLEPLVRRWNERGGPLRFAADGEDGLLVSAPLEGAWEASAGRWRWRHPLPPGLAVEPGDRARLFVEDLELTVPPPRDSWPRATLIDDEVAFARRDVPVASPPPSADDDPPPREARLALRIERGPPGRCAENQAGRATIEDGLVVWPGERVERTCDVPAGSVLRFQRRLRAFAPGTRATFRVRLDGEVVHESSAEAGPARPAPVVVPLGPAARAGARFTFEVDGDPAATAFAQPVIGPADVGTHAARPWPDARPDVVVFLADTCRADLLAMHGADGVMPAVDALAERSVRFPRAHSASTWTLPTHASLFSGVWPPQHGAEDFTRALPEAFETLAELFTAAGYRTAAMTDGLYLARAFGMDQGFQWFQVLRDGGAPRLPVTLGEARALVEADDGRPLFLFVHSYRLHSPYRRGAEEDSSESRRLRRAGTALARRLDDAAEREAAVAPYVEAMHAEYVHGARALDAQLGPWLADLEGRGLFRRGLLVFTSDHGESFWEHGRLSHGGPPYDVEALVPLLVHGGGHAPREVPTGVSLVDLAPTLAAHCGLAPLPHWQGRDLFALDGERDLFVSVRQHDERHVGVLHGGRKVLATGVGHARLPEDVFAAYDTAADPGERTDVLGEAAWPGELAGRAASLWEAQQGPLVEGGEVELDEEMLEELRRLGYTGD